jgi:hypothetical protein
LIVPALLAVCVSWPLLADAQGGQTINVQFANESVPLTSNARTVGALLNELSIDLPADYRLDPPVDAALKDGMTVRLDGMTVTRGTTEREIPIEVEFFEAYRFGAEECCVADPGQEGLVQTTWTIFCSNGQEVGRRQREQVVRQMRPRKMICFKGLNPSEDGPSADEILAARAKPGNWHTPPKRYKKAITMNSSAYEPGPRSCGKYATGYTSCARSSSPTARACSSRATAMPWPETPAGRSTATTWTSAS